MIKTVADMENVVEKDQLIFLLANQMKKASRFQQSGKCK